MINKITAETGATVDIDDDGLVTIASPNGESIDKALAWIKSLVEEPEVGKIYNGTVVTIKDFGAFVNIMPGIDGMLHISQISDKRIDKVEVRRCSYRIRDIRRRLCDLRSGGLRSRVLGGFQGA